MRYRIRACDMKKGETYYVASAGCSPFTFEGHDDNGDFLAVYPSSRHVMRSRGYVYQDTTEQQPKENTMTKLYEMTIDGKQKFGNKLAVNSSGDWVMEIKGEGTVMSVPKANVAEVVPYTVSVKFCVLGEQKTYAYFSTKGDWEVGDFVIIDSAASNGLATVTAVNSKSPAATKWLTGLKLQGTYIKSGE